jgi:hypothetical protein
MRSSLVPGISLAVTKNGALAYLQGYCEARPGVAMSADTPCLIGSVSKGLTAFGLMTLVDEGKIDPDNKVMDYLPGFKTAGRLLAPFYGYGWFVDREGITHSGDTADFHAWVGIRRVNGDSWGIVILLLALLSLYSLRPWYRRLMVDPAASSGCRRSPVRAIVFALIFHFALPVAVPLDLPALLENTCTGIIVFAPDVGWFTLGLAVLQLGIGLAKAAVFVVRRLKTSPAAADCQRITTS